MIKYSLTFSNVRPSVRTSNIMRAKHQEILHASHAAGMTAFRMTVSLKN